MAEEKYVDRNIVILPADEIEQLLIQWGKEVDGEYATDFILRKDGPFSHFTIYQARYPKENEAAVKENASAIAESTKPFEVNCSGLSQFVRILFYDIEKDDALQSFHMQFVEALNPLRQYLLIPIHADMTHDPTTVSDAERESISLYGNPKCVDTFEPHFSFARLKNGSEVELAKELITPRDRSFQAHRIALTTIGPHGTCPEILETFELTG